MGLQTYWDKRDFKKTREPRGRKKSTRTKNSFVIQKHDASHLHYDFRLELDGVLKSWAVPKGPSLDPSQKRLAMEVEDHPVDYADFEGEIPEGEYGGGEVIVWDQGKWIPKGDPHEGLAKGRLEFELKGEKLHGAWVLVRTRPTGARSQWLLIKRHDEAAIAETKYDVTRETSSVLSDRVLTRDSPGTRKRTVVEGLGKKLNSKYGRKLTAARRKSSKDTQSETVKKKPRADASARRSRALSSRSSPSSARSRRTGLTGSTRSNSTATARSARSRAARARASSREKASTGARSTPH